MSGPNPRKREHPNFQSRSARDEAGELSRRYSIEGDGASTRPSASREHSNPYEPATNDSTPPPHDHEFTNRLLHIHQHDGEDASKPRKSSASGKRRQGLALSPDSMTKHVRGNTEDKKVNGDSVPKQGLGPRPIGGAEKLGMFSGVYVPTCLNVLSILMFLRFGFILGQYSIEFRLLRTQVNIVRL